MFTCTADRTVIIGHPTVRGCSIWKAVTVVRRLSLLPLEFNTHLFQLEFLFCELKFILLTLFFCFEFLLFDCNFLSLDIHCYPLEFKLIMYDRSFSTTDGSILYWSFNGFGPRTFFERRIRI